MERNIYAHYIYIVSSLPIQGTPVNFQNRAARSELNGGIRRKTEEESFRSERGGSRPAVDMAEASYERRKSETDGTRSEQKAARQEDQELYANRIFPERNPIYRALPAGRPADVT